MSGINYISEVKEKSTLDNLFILTIILFPLFFLSQFALNLSLILISFYFVYYIIKNEFYSWLKKDVPKTLLFFWLYLVFISVFLHKGETEIFKSLSFIRYILFFFSIIFILPKLNFKIKKIFYFYLIVALIFSFDVIIQFIFGKNILGFPCQMSCQRNASFFGQELVAGTFILNFGICGLLYFFMEKKNKYFFLILFFLITISIFLTGDRTPFFMMIFIILFNIFFNKYLRKTFLKILPILVLLIIILTLNINKVSNRYIKNLHNMFQSSELTIETINWWIDERSKTLKYLNYKHFSEYVIKDNPKKLNELNAQIKEFEYDIMVFKQKKERVEKVNNYRKNNNSLDKWYNKFFDTQYGAHYLTAFSIFLEKPFIGAGIKSFRNECKKHANINSFSSQTRCSTHPHNMHLEILSETGLIGYAIFLVLLFQSIKIFFKKNYRDNLLLIFIFSLFLSHIIPFRPSGSFFSTWNSASFWLSFSLFSLFTHLKSNY